MASVSGATNSLGNTALRGFGGLATGIDRDSLIEQLTAGTSSKITKQKLAMTKLTWKQDAFRSISNKILDLQDRFLDFSSKTSLRNSSFFGKNQITAVGDSNISKYVKVSGSSDMVDYLSILGVKQLASSAQQVSDSKGDASAITTGITANKFENGPADILSSNLEGTKLTFGTYDSEQRFNEAITFTFPSSYVERDADGKPVKGPDGKDKVVEIDYTKPPKELVADLNKALKSQQFMSDKAGKSGIEFVYDDATKKISINKTADISEAGKNYVIQDSSSALKALGFNQTAAGKLPESDRKDGISLDEFNAHRESFEEAYINRQTLKEYLVGKSISVTYGGQTKTIELLTEAEKGTITKLDDLKNAVQNRLDRAFGSGKITADTTGGSLSFQSVSKDEFMTISADSVELRKQIGIQLNQSNKISLDSSLKDSFKSLGFADEADLKNGLKNFSINGVKLEGLTEDTTVRELISQINNNKEMGVRAAYMENTNQFVLTATETGSGRTITLDGGADKIFGCNGGKGYSKDGQDAKVLVSYGDGLEREVTSSSNSFELEGLTVTVNNTFGIKEEKDTSGNLIIDYTRDKAQRVTFSSAADSKGVTERVKSFIEAYNELVKEVNSQSTTKPSNYKPLTDEQKKEMDKESIENWEKKAKEGLLFSNPTIRDLGSGLQGVLSGLMGNGVDAKELEKIGITMSEDTFDGGILKFDEDKFKAAMESDPEKVSNIFAGGGEVNKGLVQLVEETLTPFATRLSYKNGGSYGRLIEEAGSDKVALSLTKNLIYGQLGEMQKAIDKLNVNLKREQDRYISQFSRMEVLINQMNSQSGYLASMMG